MARRVSVPRDLQIANPDDGKPTREFSRVLDPLSVLTVENDAIADAATETAAANLAKINEILAMLRTAGLIKES